ncbi:hypothetical protein [Pseudomonas allokribbensis]|uniref:hypothetical protein n=1 Tax=Pseudomonas allokribbensis TaxID=2774460 RepID=UPI001787D5EB|nr:hypothetical protein [Pseudomonas allokribbensis]
MSKEHSPLPHESPSTATDREPELGASSDTQEEPPQMPGAASSVEADAMKNDKKPESKPAPTVFSEHINTDNRAVGDWKSKYDESARCEIRVDAIYVGVVFLLTLLALLFTWRGSTYSFFVGSCTTCAPEKFNQYAFFFLGGILGGTMFGLKYLYQVVARGLWNIDRRLWRIFSPFLSGGAALAIGGLLDSGLLGLSIKSSTTSFYFSMGFISGYFADKALGKMQEIADTVFGSSPSSPKK